MTQAVLQHLNFHRALHDGDDQKMREYMEMATEEVTSFKDPHDRAIALAFHVVLEGHMDPWSLDLSQFAREYLARVQDVGVDLVTAGRLVHMAWAVLAEQAHILHDRMAPREDEEPDLAWDDLPDAWLADDEAWDVTERIMQSDPIDPLVMHRSERPVSLMELVGALEDAREEADRRIKLKEARKKERKRLKASDKDRARGQVHKENLEEEIRQVAKHLAGLGPDQVPMAATHDGTKEGYITSLVAMLFLSRVRAVKLEQENFPVGPITVTILDRQRLIDGIKAEDLPKAGQQKLDVDGDDEDATEAAEQGGTEAEAPQDEGQEAEAPVPEAPTQESSP